MRKVLLLTSALMMSLGVITAVQSHADPSTYSWAAGLPGCDTSRPAIAHHADRQVLPDQPVDGPVPCGTPTGMPSMENRIEVTNDNTVIYDVALVGGPLLGGDGHTPGWGRNETLARTVDEGRSWNTVSIPIWPDSYVLDGQTDNNIYVDHETGRVFFYMQNSGPIGINTYCGGTFDATVAYSDDSGTTWNWAFDHDHSCAENPTVLTAHPKLDVFGGQRSYPNVVYLCGDNTSSGAATLGTPGFSCSKSVNGGASWLGTTVQGPLNGQSFYSGLAKDLLAPYPECAGQSSSAGAGVQPLPDGTLLVVMTCNGTTYLVGSADEGHTWNVRNAIPHSGSLRADSAGNLFLLQKGMDTSGNTLLLSHSTDGGVTWSPEVNMIAPGVDTVGTMFFVQGTYQAGEVGHVAVAYYGTRTDMTTSDGFITETRDALDDNPVFWSGQVNSLTRPLLYNVQTSGNIGLTVLDFNGGAFSPDGRSVWGSWVQDCGANIITDQNCLNRLPTTSPGNPDDGFAGRLVWPPQYGK
jgi:hypothetical protein